MNLLIMYHKMKRLPKKLNITVFFQKLANRSQVSVFWTSRKYFRNESINKNLRLCKNDQFHFIQLEHNKIKRTYWVSFIAAYLDLGSGIFKPKTFLLVFDRRLYLVWKFFGLLSLSGEFPEAPVNSFSRQKKKSQHPLVKTSLLNY